jgi:hypothetical protein
MDALRLARDFNGKPTTSETMKQMTSKMKPLIIRGIYTLIILMMSAAAVDAMISGSNYATQQTNQTMNTNTILTIAVALMLLTFQMASGQEAKPGVDFDSGAMKDLEAAKKAIDDGKITQKFLDDNPYNDLSFVILMSLNAGKRSDYISRNGSSDSGKKALADACDAIVKSLNSKSVSAQPAMDPTLKFALAEITDTKNIIEEFDPKTQRFTAQWKWIWFAISKKERDRWAAEFFKSGNISQFKPRFYQELDALSASCAKKIPTFKPGAELFANHNTTEEALMKKQLGDATKVTIHKIGLQYADWEVQKNNLDVPQKRFKRGYVWGKDSRDDFSFCKLYQVNVIQDYMGGGAYGETYAVLLDSWPRGCPK